MSNTGNYGKTDAEKLALLRKHKNILSQPDKDMVMRYEGMEIGGLRAVDVHTLVQLYDDKHTMIEAAELRLNPTPAAPSAKAPSDSVLDEKHPVVDPSSQEDLPEGDEESDSDDAGSESGSEADGDDVA